MKAILNRNRVGETGTSPRNGMRKCSPVLRVFGALSIAILTAYLLKKRRYGNLPNQSVYRFYAPLYDALFGPTYARARLRAAGLLDLRPDERLLIPGVGTGLDLPLVPPGVQVTGIDVSAEMLAQARVKAAGREIDLRVMDAQALDLPSGSFDAALLSLIVSVAPDGRRVFAEAVRVLKPGGRLVLFDKFAPDGKALTPMRRLLGAMISLIGTDVNRRLSEIIGSAPVEIELDEPSLFGGQYRILFLRKR